jgi:hypothetical protein
MKRLRYSILFLLVVLTTRLHGDIIIVEPTQSKICTKITNLKDFPELVVVGLTDCVTLPKSKRTFKVKNNSCIKVHKSCPVSLYVMDLDYYKQNDLEEIEWDKDSNVQKLNISIKEKYFNSFDYSSATVDLNLANYMDSIYYLYKSKLTYKYKYDSENPKADSVQYFEDDVDPLKPISVKTENAR